MNWFNHQANKPYLSRLILGAMVLTSTCALSQTLEQELASWKNSPSFAGNHKASPTKRTAPQNFVSEIARVDQINPNELFSNKVGDPKIKQILEEAYAKPNAVVIHATVH